MRVFGVAFLVTLFLCAALMFSWAMRDARRRGKPPLAVGLLVFVGFPLGLLIWIVFRPPLLPRMPLEMSYR